MSVVLRYIGRGKFFPDIPARDLTDRDLRLLQPDISKLIESGLYEKIRSSKPAPKSNKSRTGGAENKEQ